MTDPARVAHDGHQPLVSVITIFLNAEQFIEEAIESVLAQTYPHWELILVDDASTDGSAAIAQRFTAQHPDRIRYFQHPDGCNHGLSASRNLGLRHTRGEMVAFLDADDLYRPGKLENQVRLLLAHPSADMVYGITEHWFSWTGRPEDADRDAPKRLGVPPDTLVRPPRLIPSFLSGEAQTPGTSGFLVRREAALRVGGFEEAFRAMSEDAVFFYKIALQADVFVEGGQWDRYRQHPDSLSNAMRRLGEYRASGPNPSRRRFLRWLEGYLRDQGISDPDVWRALQEQMRPYRNPISYAIAELSYRLHRLRVAVAQRLRLK
jgi:glycosyltransferase involved in cell wall biosynthesis